MNQIFYARHWHAYVYEQYENQTDDVEFILQLLQEHAPGAQNILEAACGGGRIAVPLAEAGHRVTGFDSDEHMLLRCGRRAKGLGNLHIYAADMMGDDWGAGYDVVVLGGNILINIETDKDYKQAQIDMITKAAAALRTGGHLLMDFQLLYDDKGCFHSLEESSYFQGADDIGTSGRTVSYGGTYDPVTQLWCGVSHFELTLPNGAKWIGPRVRHKHIPKQAQVYAWLADAGLVVEHVYKNHSKEPLPCPIDEDTYRATIWARKM